MDLTLNIIYICMYEILNDNITHTHTLVLCVWFFQRCCPILKNPAALAALTDLFEEHVRTSYQQVDLIVGLDARGFLFGPLLKGKLPGSTTSVTFDLEYGQAEVEIQDDVVDPGQKVLIIDDLLATGGYPSVCLISPCVCLISRSVCLISPCVCIISPCVFNKSVCVFNKSVCV
uniref:adenine phosphoribosyltransferase n=1 Tax=Gouania willdenowi TaxID=441366 RepID=A0A8C5H6X8_GOUWI